MTFVLCILDGWGYTETNYQNAIMSAEKPEFDKLWSNYSHCLLEASGLSAGLPPGQVGNSEVGHLTIGAGRVVLQELPRIDRAIKDGGYNNNDKIQSLISGLKASGKTCHILGIASDGGVHGHIKHFLTTYDILSKSGVKVMAHIFCDGRDTPPKSVMTYLKEFEAANIKIATISGRYYAMDRDKRYDRTYKAYQAIALAQAPKFSNCFDLIDFQYQNNITDEFIEPHIADFYHGIEAGDALFFINYRTDRIRQLCSSLINPNFTDFTNCDLKLSKVLCMRPYSEELTRYSEVIFPDHTISRGLGEVLSQYGKNQLRVAETEKYAHVTYFFNGGVEAPYQGEERVLIPSPRIATYDLMPQMSCYEICRTVIEACKSGKYDFICVNFANADMVGHSGNFAATVKAVEAIDQCLGQIVKAVLERNGEMLITADHGNAEQMIDPHTQQPFTAHTLNKVPLIYVSEKKLILKDGQLSDVAPTILHLMDLKIPSEMSGKILL